jgi:isopentenyl diphosphate isomerase/L-lactate dehydrogenase-like FMN-dependent dehydrogenase
VVAVATATLVALTAAEGAPEQKVANFLTAANKELKMFARVAGKDDLAKLAPEDVVAGSLEVAGHTGLRLA